MKQSLKMKLENLAERQLELHALLADPVQRCGRLGPARAPRVEESGSENRTSKGPDDEDRRHLDPCLEALMELTIHLPEDLGRRVSKLRDPESFITDAVAKALGSLGRKEARASEASSRWAKLVERVEADPIHLDGYSGQLKRDMREFRDDFAFRHDREP